VVHTKIGHHLLRVFILSDSNYYSKFLHENDFDTYQSNINLNPHTREYLVQALHAERELTRAIWLMNRLTRYGDVHWSLLNKEFQVHYAMILYYEDLIKHYDDYSRQQSEGRTKKTEIGTKSLVQNDEFRQQPKIPTEAVI